MLKKLIDNNYVHIKDTVENYFYHNHLLALNGFWFNIAMSYSYSIKLLT